MTVNCSAFKPCVVGVNRNQLWLRPSLVCFARRVHSDDHALCGGNLTALDFIPSRNDRTGAGYAVGEEEYVEPSAASPLPYAAVIASVGFSASMARFSRERDAAAARNVCEAATEIRAILSADAEE